MDGIALLTVFVLAVFVGYEVISKVSSTLHTPLMSGSNAISGIVLVGTIAVAAHTESTAIFVLELVAIVLATVNLVGGFVVTDRMLRMFRSRGRKTSRGQGAAGVNENWTALSTWSPRSASSSRSRACPHRRRRGWATWSVPRARWWRCSWCSPPSARTGWCGSWWRSRSAERSARSPRAGSR